MASPTPILTVAPLRQALAGACGGMLAFLFLEPRARSAELAGESGDIFGSVLMLGLVFGGVVCAILAVSDAAPSGSLPRMLARGIMAGLLGAFIGVFSSIGANVVYAILRQFTLMGGGLGFQIIARTIGWALFGTGVGVVAGILSRSPRRTSQGAWGGLIGGALGGLVFDMITITTQSQTATLSRLIGFTTVAAFVGFATALVEELARQAWLVFLGGAREGRQVILHRDVVLGRDELVDVPLFGDPSVAKRQAEIFLHPQPYIRDIGDQQLLQVDGMAVREAVLGDGMVIQLGRHRLRFHHRLAGPHSAAAFEPYPTGTGQPWPATPPPSAIPVPGPIWPDSNTTPVAPENWPKPVYSEGGCGPVLRVVGGPNAGTLVSLDYDPCTIGRELDNNLPLADGRTSRYHARVSFVEEEESWVLEDLGSTNGTTLNGIRVSRAGLAPGDMIQLGDTRISVEAPTISVEPHNRTIRA